MMLLAFYQILGGFRYPLQIVIHGKKPGPFMSAAGNAVLGTVGVKLKVVLRVVCTKRNA